MYTQKSCVPTTCTHKILILMSLTLNLYTENSSQLLYSKMYACAFVTYFKLVQRQRRLRNASHPYLSGNTR